MARSKRPHYDGKGNLGWGLRKNTIMKDSRDSKAERMLSEREQDDRADRLYKERLIAEGESTEWAEDAVNRYRSNRTKRRLESFKAVA